MIFKNNLGFRLQLIIMAGNHISGKSLDDKSDIVNSFRPCKVFANVNKQLNQIDESFCPRILFFASRDKA